ncbi:peptidoglycan editing factor PgeF [Niallia sp. Krafla_26]|uniref:peptidoglycan editing factor PgeF n=1 Tax=Niallia sp. Krafla_26 TaxID=3064703 RepID=UPI003D17ED32
MEPFVLEEKEFFSLSQWVGMFPDLTVGFTTKNGGKSDHEFDSLNMGFHVNDTKKNVCENREILAKKLDFPIQHWVGAEQTHEVQIKTITHSDKGMGANTYDSAFSRTDGFFTLDKGILLTLCFADCVPLYFLHPQSKTIGIAHAGWKGTVNGIARDMIQNFQVKEMKASEILVAIGPSICENCYIVDDNVINLVQNRLEGVEILPYNEISDGQYRLNLKECNKQILLLAGVLPENILVTKLCTSCHKDLFYSHRRDQGKTGRMISFIGWKETKQKK